MSSSSSSTPSTTPSPSSTSPLKAQSPSHSQTPQPQPTPATAIHQHQPSPHPISSALRPIYIHLDQPIQSRLAPSPHPPNQSSPIPPTPVLHPRSKSQTPQPSLAPLLSPPHFHHDEFDPPSPAVPHSPIGAPLEIVPAAEDGIEPAIAGSFPWAPPNDTTQAKQQLTGQANVATMLAASSLSPMTRPTAEYSLSVGGKNGSQSFHQDSSLAHAFANELAEEDSTVVGPIGLMDPNSHATNQNSMVTILPPAGVLGKVPSGSGMTGVGGASVGSIVGGVGASPVSGKHMMQSKDNDEYTLARASTTGGGGSNSPEPNGGNNIETDFYAQPPTHDLHTRLGKRTKKGWCARNCKCPASCGGYNFVKVFVILSAAQVILSCVLVWLVGYLGLIQATDQLSAQVRDAIMSGVITDVDTRLGEPIRVAREVNYLTQARFEGIENRDEIRNESGWLADLYHLGLNYPNTARMGYMTSRNLYVSIQKRFSGDNYTSQDGVYIVVSNATTGTTQTYQPNPLPFRNRVKPNPPLTMFPEIRPNDSADFIRRYLGDPIHEDPAFNYLDVKITPGILNAIGVNNTVRKLDPDRATLGAGWSPPFSAVDRVTDDNSEGYFTLAAWVPTINPQTGEFLMASFVYIKLIDLERSMRQQPYGSNGAIHIVRAGGDIVASTVPEYQNIIQETQDGIELKTSQDGMIQKIHEFLLEWRLVVDTVRSNISGATVPFTGQLFTKSFSHGGTGYRIEAKQVSRNLTALSYTVVLITADSDFDGGVATLIRTTALVAAGICIAAVLLTFAITRCITRPLMSVVDYMDRAVKVISMDRGQSQREALASLCEAWSSDSGMIMPPLLASGAHPAALQLGQDPFQGTPLYASFCWLCNDKGDTCCCYRVGRSLREVQQMHAAYGSLLYTLASYDELEAINQAKRQFIRYIFHEVRVPFNAIVMGIEQMQLELAPHQLTFGSTIETLDILREQSAVVSRILNDVLSMQKIEDGALALEFDNFSLDKMIRGALYAFRTPCLEKRLKVRVNLQSLDELVAEALPGLRLGKARTRISKGGSGTRRTIQTTEQIATSMGGKSVDGTTLGNSSLPRTTLGQRNSTLTQSNMSELSGSQPEVYHAQVRGDPYRLRQCLANFVSNAIKFTPIGGLIRVSLDVSRFEVNPLASIASDQLLISMGIDPKQQSNSSRGSHTTSRKAHPSWHQPPPTAASTMPHSLEFDGAQPRPGEKVRAIVPELLGTVMVKVTVKDSGPGIPPEHQKHVFEAYHQVQAGKIQKGNGTGLGLNITRSIVELHGGQISYNSEPDGAEFFFSLPMDVMLVRTGSKGDSSSYGGTSHTPARSDADASQMSDRKLETIAGSPEQITREIPNCTAEGDTSRPPSPILGAATISPDEVEMAAFVPTIPDVLHPQDPPHQSTDTNVRSQVPPLNVATPASDVSPPGSGPVQPSLPPIHTASLSSKQSPSQHPGSSSSRSSPEQPISSLNRHAPDRVERGLSSTSTSHSDKGAGNSSPGADEFYGSSTQRSSTRTRGLRGAQLGVAIPSLAANTLHSSAQNLTASVKPGPNAASTSGATNSTVAVTNGGTVSTASLPPSGTVASSAAATAVPSSTGVALPPVVATNTTGSTVAPVAGSQMRPAANANASSSSSPNSLQGLRVLVVEDSHPNRKLLLSLLNHMGCQSFGVENGQECVDLFKNVMTSSPSSKTQHIMQLPTTAHVPAAHHHLRGTNLSSSTIPAVMPHYPFDIILMDGSMPVLNGVEATQILRQHGVLIPIIAVTGNALAEDQAAFLAAGAQGVLTKPINKKRLQEVLNAFSPKSYLTPYQQQLQQHQSPPLVNSSTAPTTSDHPTH